MQVARGLGAMVAMIAASQMCVATMSPALMKDASSLLNLIRNIGGAFGISIMSTVLFQSTAVHAQALASGVSASGARAQAFLGEMTQRMEVMGASDPGGAARKMIGFMIQRDAAVLGYIDAFAVVAAGSLLAAVIGFLATPAGLRAPAIAPEPERPEPD